MSLGETEEFAAEVARAMDRIDLEKVCWRCDGSGERPTSIGSDSGWTFCRACWGSGKTPTDLGDRILDLVRHNLTGLLEGKS